MKKILIFLMVLLFCSFALARPTVSDATNKLGGFSGDGGSNQDDSCKASLDLAHTDIDAILRDLGIVRQTSGSIFYVDVGVSGTTGVSWATAVADIEAATALCTASAGDIIAVAPGHVEAMTAANDIDLDKAGIIVIGFGTGELAPTLTYTTNGEFVFGADDCEVHNFNFVAGNAVVHAIDVETGAEDYIINDCRFWTTSVNTDEFIDCIDIAATSDNGKITNCEFEMGAASAVSAISHIGSDFTEISDNLFSGDFSTACIEDATTASIWMIIKDNVLINGDTAGALNAVAAISLKADTSALVFDNKIFCDMTEVTAIVSAVGFVTANTYKDDAGSVLEVGKTYVRTFTLPAATDDDMFLVAGGNILITSLTGYVTTDIGAQCTISIIMDHVDQDFEFTSALDINAAVDGGMIAFTNADPPAPVIRAVGADSGAQSEPMNWQSPPGMIELLDADGGTTGVIEWSLVFIPLDEGVTVTPQ